MTTRAESDVLADSRPEGGARADDSPLSRVLNGLVIAASVAGLVAADRYLGGRVVICLSLAALVGVALWEFYGLAARGGVQPLSRVGIAAGVVLTGGLWVEETLQLPFSPLPLLGALVLFWTVVAQVISRGVRRAWEEVGVTVLGLALVWFPVVFLLRIRSYGVGAFLMFVAVVKLSDVAAYVVGRALGRRALAPVISPNKTMAGAGAALVAGVGLAVGFNALWPGGCGGLSTAVAALFGALTTSCGMLGDLGESVFKRAASAKDASRLLPGFGGVLDVIDSVWGAAPVAYLILALWGTTT